MNVQLTNVSDTRKSLVVTLDKSEVDAEHQAVLGEFTKQARIPGFRPGKAPAAMVSKRFAKDIGEEFKQKVITKAYRTALEKEKLDVLNIVNVEEGPIQTGNEVSVTVTVDVRPEFTLPDYSSLATEVDSTEASDADIDNVIQGLRSERADFKVTDRASQKGDYLKLAYEGFVDGKPIAEIAPDKQLYSKVPQTWEEVEGANEGIIPGLGKDISGLKAGDKKTVTINFPAEFAAVPALSGLTASYNVDVLEVRERILPELNEEFFKSQNATDLETLKGQIKTNLTQQKEFQNKSSQRQQITEALAAKTDFTPPESLVDSETQSVLRQFIEENMRRGIAADQFEKDKKELFEGAKKAAATRVKVQLILAKIAEAEKLTVSERDIDTFIYREAARTRSTPEKLVKELQKNRDAVRSIQQQILFDKAVDFLVSKATVTVRAPKAS